MNKAELVGAVAERTGLSKKDSNKAISAVFEVIISTLQTGEKVHLVGFGVFDIKERAARLGRNIRTNEEVEIPATHIAVFKPSKLLKAAVDQQL